MADILNVAACAAGGNTGLFPCAFNPSIFRRFIAIPKGYVIAASTLTSAAAVRALITAGLKEDSPGQRWHMSGMMTQQADETTAPVMENKDNFMVLVQLPPYNVTYDITWQFAQFAKWKGGYQQCQAFYDFLFIDDQGNLIGTQKTDANDAIGMGGVSLFQFVVQDYKFADISRVSKFNVTLSFMNNAEVNTGMAMIQAGINPADYEQLLLDINLSQGATSNTATHIYFTAKFNGIGAIGEVGDLYGTVLDALGAWVFTKNGTTLTPSGIAYRPATKDWDLTVSSLSSADVVTITLQPPSVVTATPYFAPLVSDTYTYTHP